MNCGHPSLVLAIPGPSLRSLYVVSAALTGPGSGSVRSVSQIFSCQDFILKIWEKSIGERTDRPGNFVGHPLEWAMSRDDGRPRTGRTRWA